jgi:hypothetical protein
MLTEQYNDARKLLSDAKFYEGYSRFIPEENRYETWLEAVDRVMNMHKKYYANKITENPELINYINEATDAYHNKLVLGAQRALQFGGDQLLKHPMRLYNCVSSYADRPAFFGEVFYVLLCGAGAGFSTQFQHVKKLPKILPRTKQPKTHLVEDSIEGWATALDVLMSSFFEDGGKHPEFKGRKVYFDLSSIRPKGAMISGGFKAPGPDPLRRTLDRIEYLLTGLILNEKAATLRPIHVYDIVMHVADAVLSGGIRRAATICLFSVDDSEMMNAKTGNWFNDNPQRARSNNSAVIVRNKVTREQFAKIMESIKQFGEPGFFFVDDEDITTNPCVTADTMVTIKEDDNIINVPITDLVGSKTLPLAKSMNLETGAIEWKKILWADKTRDSAAIFTLELEDGKSITCTPDHKIYTSNRGYVEAKDLTNTDAVVTETGTSHIAKIITKANEDVYDITVEDNHNFYANGILIHNCVEIGMFPQYNGESGFQGCNLSEINGGACSDEETFYKACRAGAILGTLQAGYTDFKFMTASTKKIFEREALLGVSITGWMNNPDILFNDKILQKGAQIVKDVNKEVSALLGINQAARTTCAKPSGNASVLLMTASGIHADHSPLYIRNVQLNKETEVAKLIRKVNPNMVEESVWSAGKTDYVVSFPVIPKEGTIYKNELIGVKHLELVKLAQENWVNAGTNIDLCINKSVRHNISNTIIVDDWDEIEEYVFNNKEYFAGISFLAATGDKDYNQAPNTAVLNPVQIVEKYGPGAIFGSGLVVESLKVFDNLWVATSTALGYGEDIDADNHENNLKKEWIRRFDKFAENYFNGDKKLTEYCLKDVYILHKWEKIQQTMLDIDWSKELTSVSYTDIDTMGAAACSGPMGCEI